MKVIRIMTLMATMVLLISILLLPNTPSDLIEADELLKAGDYEKAIPLLVQGNTDPLIVGNACYHAGEAYQDSQNGDPEKVKELWGQALKYYEQGIQEEWDRVDLKYNYEFVQAALKSHNQDQEDQKDQQEDGDTSKQDSQDQQDDQTQKESDGQEDKQNQQEDGDTSKQDSQDQQDDQTQEESQNQEANQNQEDGDNQDGNLNQQGEQDQEEGDSQEGNQGQDGDDSQEGNQGQDGTIDQAQEGTENTDDKSEAVNTILKMLEAQEAESLKNNQEVINSDEGGGKNDW